MYFNFRWNLVDRIYNCFFYYLLMTPVMKFLPTLEFWEFMPIWRVLPTNLLHILIIWNALKTNRESESPLYWPEWLKKSTIEISPPKSHKKPSHSVSGTFRCHCLLLVSLLPYPELCCCFDNLLELSVKGLSVALWESRGHTWILWEFDWATMSTRVTLKVSLSTAEPLRNDGFSLVFW